VFRWINAVSRVINDLWSCCCCVTGTPRRGSAPAQGLCQPSLQGAGVPAATAAARAWLGIGKGLAPTRVTDRAGFGMGTWLSWQDCTKASRGCSSLRMLEQTCIKLHHMPLVSMLSSARLGGWLRELGSGQGAGWCLPSRILAGQGPVSGAGEGSSCSSVEVGACKH